jgi:site-specific DNA-methyltransferase (adenine-specific)
MDIKTTHKIIFGDAREMSEIDDNSIQLILTSPPYWQLKDYGIENQIGYNQTYEDYINHLNLVWKECYRVLSNGCRLCINIGDQFARSVYYGRYKIIPIHSEIIKFCESIGFDYMGSIIWQKPTTMNTTGGATVMGSYPFPRNGIIKIDYEYILIFKKPGQYSAPSNQIKEASRLTKEEWNEYFSGHWNFNGEKQDKHIAMFPEELPKRLIKMFSFVGDTVLDPFLGSGTTTLASIKLNRNSIGYEINNQFENIIKEKLNFDNVNKFNVTNIQLIEQKSKNKDWQKEIENLPYKFRDLTKFDKKIDPKKLNFGSTIDVSDKMKKEEFFSIKEILEPNHLVLNTGLKIKLLGVKPKKETFNEALEFLNLKLKNQKVFLKFDTQKYDNDGNLLCYLYLKNKTFINAHLIKNKLVDIDSNIDFRFKDKFQKLLM